MGLAASQARFLGITLRKANCEFQSTSLAQDKLELTNQLSAISQDYANALNSTKLVWQNDAVDGDYGVSYGLLMMPSAANDYNPYMVSTKSGAIVLNSKYAAAAEAAGIGKSGGTPSQAGRDKFLESLTQGSPVYSNGSLSKDSNGNIQYKNDNQNVITPTTYEMLTGKDFDGDGRVASSSEDVAWHYSAGMGAIPKNKGVADGMTLSALVADKSIGGQTLDWLQIVKYEMKSKSMTKAETESVVQGYKDNVSAAKLAYVRAESSNPNFDISKAAETAEEALGTNKGLNYSDWDWSKEPPVLKTAANSESGKIMQKISNLEQKIANASDEGQKAKYQTELDNYKKGMEKDSSGKFVYINGDSSNEYKYSLYWAIYQEARAEAKASQNLITWSDDTKDNSITGTSDNNSIYIGSLLKADNKAELGTGTYQAANLNSEDVNKMNTYGQITVVSNDAIEADADILKDMKISDLFTQNIVLMSTNSDNAANDLEQTATAILKYVAEKLGYGNIGVGLNVDTTSNEALTMAFEMTKKKILKASNAVKGCGGNNNNKSMLNNDAYKKANSFNRICVNSSGQAAINMSNVVSAFLTYYDNFLRGSESEYIVGRGIDSDDTSKSKTTFVTDNPDYVYVTNSANSVSNDTKIADFWNELYNNICAHGWRYDDSVQDNEYLESAIKDGRYSLMALNNDGYFYQQRYNDISYMQEVTDNDAISRAEAQYTQKKAEITYKEDNIDIKTKKLDAEIAELTTEMNSVQSIISKSIEKTFSMFSN